MAPAWEKLAALAPTLTVAAGRGTKNVKLYLNE